MKNLALTLSLLAGPVLAENDICADLGGLGEYSMYARLSGVPFSNVLGRLNEELQDLEEELQDFYNLLELPQEQRRSVEEIAFFIATDVYETPRSSSDEDPRIVALDYRSKNEIKCYRDLRRVKTP